MLFRRISIRVFRTINNLGSRKRSGLDARQMGWFLRGTAVQCYKAKTLGENIRGTSESPHGIDFTKMAEKGALASKL